MPIVFGKQLIPVRSRLVYVSPHASKPTILAYGVTISCVYHVRVSLVLHIHVCPVKLVRAASTYPAQGMGEGKEGACAPQGTSGAPTQRGFATALHV